MTERLGVGNGKPTEVKGQKADFESARVVSNECGIVFQATFQLIAKAGGMC